MSIFTVDDQGQLIVTPSELDEFEYYRDNILVRRFQETMDFKYIEILQNWIYDKPYLDGDSNGMMASLVDSSGNIHILATTRNKTYHIHNTSGNWVKEEIIDEKSGSYANLIIDSSGKLHAFYYLYVLDKFQYATNTTGSWVTTDIETSVDTIGSGASDLFLDSSNKIHIFYTTYRYDPRYNRIRHATNASSSWAIETINETTAFHYRYCCQAVQKSDLNTFVVVYCYQDQNDFTVATGSWGSWVEDDMGFLDGAGPGMDLIIDSSEIIHLFYGAESGDYDLRYANDDGGWSNISLLTVIDPLLEDDGFRYVAVLLKNGKFHLSCVDAGSNGSLIVYGTNELGSWNFEIVLDSRIENYVSVFYKTNIINISGEFHLIYGVRETGTSTDNIHRAKPVV